jgi:hypothetical protein
MKGKERKKERNQKRENIHLILQKNLLVSIRGGRHRYLSR